MPSNTLKLLGKVGLYFLLPLAFLVIPTSWLETRRPVCLIRNIFGVKCPGCGMTRAISSLFHGRFKQAYQYNKLVVVVFPLLAFVWLQSLANEYKKLPVSSPR